ncbi:hypothetical protein FRC03_009276 [Tulasnella sp. 419]|nr:hypothetical protein FRC03_009276 [Tulasnella sp. 419]
MAVGYIVPDALTHQPPFHLKPIVECLGKTLENAYAESDGVPDKGAAGSPGGISASIGGSAAASRSATATGANATGGSSGSGNNSGNNSGTNGASLAKMNGVVALVSGFLGASVLFGASYVL